MSVFDYANPKVAKVLSFVLTDTAEVMQGDLVCGDPATGMVVPAADADNTMLALGFATRDAVGDGVAEIEVSLFEPLYLYSFANDAGGDALTLAFTQAYVKDAQTVQATGTTAALAGLALKVTADRVLVYMNPYLGV